MKKLFLNLKILQIISNEERHRNGLKRLGKGYFDAYRLNPYNPLCYLIIIILIPIFLLLYGFVGLYERAINPFKWY